MNTDVAATVAVPTVTKKQVTKADGSSQDFSTEKIQKRIDTLLEGLAVEHMSIPTCVDKVIKYAQTGKLKSEALSKHLILNFSKFPLFF